MWSDPCSSIRFQHVNKEHLGRQLTCRPFKFILNIDSTYLHIIEKYFFFYGRYACILYIVHTLHRIFYSCPHSDWLSLWQVTFLKIFLRVVCRALSIPRFTPFWLKFVSGKKCINILVLVSSISSRLNMPTQAEL